MPIFDHHQQIIIKVTFGFPEFLSIHRKSHVIWTIKLKV